MEVVSIWLSFQKVFIKQQLTSMVFPPEHQFGIKPPFTLLHAIGRLDHTCTIPIMYVYMYYMNVSKPV